MNVKIYKCLEALALIVRLRKQENQFSMTLMTLKLNERKHLLLTLFFIKTVIYIVKNINFVEQYTTDGSIVYPQSMF